MSFEENTKIDRHRPLGDAQYKIQEALSELINVALNSELLFAHTLPILKFIKNVGPKVGIGQAGMKEVKKAETVVRAYLSSDQNFIDDVIDSDYPLSRFSECEPAIAKINKALDTLVRKIPGVLEESVWTAYAAIELVKKVCAFTGHKVDQKLEELKTTAYTKLLEQGIDLINKGNIPSALECLKEVIESVNFDESAEKKIIGALDRIIKADHPVRLRLDPREIIMYQEVALGYQEEARGLLKVLRPGAPGKNEPDVKGPKLPNE
jgi:hypothetical protein